MDSVWAGGVGAALACAADADVGCAAAAVVGCVAGAVVGLAAAGAVVACAAGALVGCAAGGLVGCAAGDEHATTSSIKKVKPSLCAINLNMNITRSTSLSRAGTIRRVTMTGQRLVAEMVHGYGIDHVFLVPTILTPALAAK